MRRDSAPTPKPSVKPTTVRRRRGRSFRGLGFWILVLAGGALFFSVGALGAPHGGGYFWEELPEPFVHDDPGRWLRWGLAVLALGTYALAFFSNREQIRRSLQPGAVVMLPVFSGLCLYAAGLLAPPAGPQGPLPLRTLQGLIHSLVHPTILLPTAAGGLLAGLVLGMARDAAGPGKVLGGLLVLGSLAAGFGFAVEGDLQGTFGRLKADPPAFWPAGAAALGAVVGILLAFGSRAGGFRRMTGVALSAGAVVFVTGRGAPRLAGGLGSLPSLSSALGEHGVAFVAAMFLLYWAGWFLHRHVESR